ncbi:MAG: hypothetical protein H0W24_10530 [Lysobacter sp.]|nr:hypothetical protein [Lysobacter sp.]
MQNPTRNQDRKWRWIIGFIVVVLLVWGVARVLRDEGEALSGRAVGIAVVAPDPVVPANAPERRGAVPGVEIAGGEAIPVAAIVATPEAFHGQAVDGVAVVAADHARGVSADHGFWIEEAGRRIFVVVQDAGAKSQDDGSPAPAGGAAAAIEVRPGQRVSLSGRIHPGVMAPQLAAGLDADTSRALSSEPVFLLVEAAGVELDRR